MRIRWPNEIRASEDFYITEILISVFPVSQLTVTYVVLQQAVETGHREIKR